jgi:hypothetical protein
MLVLKVRSIELSNYLDALAHERGSRRPNFGLQRARRTARLTFDVESSRRPRVVLVSSRPHSRRARTTPAETTSRTLAVVPRWTAGTGWKGHTRKVRAHTSTGWVRDKIRSGRVGRKASGTCRRQDLSGSVKRCVGRLSPTPSARCGCCRLRGLDGESSTRGLGGLCRLNGGI